MASQVVFINGGTGFIGRALCSALIRLSSQTSPYRSSESDSDHTYQLYVQTRMPRHHRHRAITFVSSYHELPETIVPNIIVNLAGAPIADRRWSPARRKLLVDSRVRGTESLFRVISQKAHTPEVLLNASAIGFYGVRGDEILGEDGAKGAGFAADLCAEWETAAMAFEELGTRVCRMRIGVVLGPGGGALGKLLPMFRMALGGPIGNGRQWFSWIHIHDLVGLFIEAIHNPGYQGAINATAPNPVRQRDFAVALGQAVGRPAVLPAPGPLIKLIYGQMAVELLLGGQRVLPALALANGFQFRHQQLQSALSDITDY